DVQPGLGREGPVGVPAHAVEDEHQRRVARDDDGGAVLVVLAVAEGGDLRVLDLHRVRITGRTEDQEAKTPGARAKQFRAETSDVTQYDRLRATHGRAGGRCPDVRAAQRQSP